MALCPGPQLFNVFCSSQIKRHHLGAFNSPGSLNLGSTTWFNPIRARKTSYCNDTYCLYHILTLVFVRRFVCFLSSKAIVVSEIFYVFWWRNSNKYPYKQWYSLQITTIAPLCTSDVSKENNKCLWEHNHWFFGLFTTEDKDEKRKFTDLWITSVPTYSIHAQKAP